MTLPLPEASGGLSSISSSASYIVLFKNTVEILFVYIIKKVITVPILQIRKQRLREV